MAISNSRSQEHDERIRESIILTKCFAQICAFCCGLFCVALGVALTAKGTLGTTPISVLPYTLHLLFPYMSFGGWVITFNLFFIAIEWMILKSAMKPLNLLLQCSLTFLFGFCVDFSMFLLSPYDPVNYPLRLGTVCAASLILAFGVFLTIRSHLSTLPLDGFIIALSTVSHIDFGRLRLLSDVSMTLTAIAICVFFLEDFKSVREGTILAALLVGPLIKFFVRYGQKPQNNT